LTTLASRQNTPGTIGVLAGSLANLARQRPAKTQSILPALLGLREQIESLDGAQAKSTLHTLKTALLTLMKY